VSATCRTEVVRFWGYCLDPRRRLLFGSAGRAAPPSARAFDILLYLVEHPNQLIDWLALGTICQSLLEYWIPLRGSP
jgi:hypothetical protein